MSHVNRFILLLYMAAAYSILVSAQQMVVKDFTRLHRSLLHKRDYSIDRNQATLDFLTSEQGFTFLAEGRTEVEATPTDGCLTLLLPNKTRFVLVSHPSYGSLYWKVPEKPLKKKKHYQATLVTFNPTVEVKPTEQWVVFNVSPNNALLWVDSTMTTIRKGEIQMKLPIGGHTYRVEAPFYDSISDTIEVNDSLRKVVHIELAPLYSYLTVSSAFPQADIWVDGQQIGYRMATSGRLTEGKHCVEIKHNGNGLYKDWIELGKAEKKHLVINSEQLVVSDDQLPINTQLHTVKDDQLTLSDEHLTDDYFAPVLLQAPDSTISILINRAEIGTGSWQGKLKQGRYALQARKDGEESEITWIEIDDNRTKEISLAVPQASYGALSISSNVTDAEIWIADKCVGLAPCIVQHLRAERSCSIVLKKAGYIDTSITIYPPRNGIKEVKLIMKMK